LPVSLAMFLQHLSPLAHRYGFFALLGILYLLPVAMKVRITSLGGMLSVGCRVGFARIKIMAISLRRGMRKA